jgi:hypothetical protein
MSVERSVEARPKARDDGLVSSASVTIFAREAVGLRE